MKFEIMNRWTGAVQFAAKIECDENSSRSIKLGLAVQWGFKNKAVLSDAVLSGAVLRGADLSGADLRDADLSGAVLSGADLSGADLSGADLRCAVLSGADLSDADLSDAVLSGADLSEFAVPSLHRRILAAIDSGGTLDMSSWHTCETTHCRAGWAVVLAGKMGRALEFGLGTPAAAGLISIASCPALNGKVPDFYASNEDALADIRRLAETEPELTETVSICKGCGMPEIHKMCPAHGTTAYCNPSDPQWGKFPINTASS